MCVCVCVFVWWGLETRIRRSWVGTLRGNNKIIISAAIVSCMFVGPIGCGPNRGFHLHHHHLHHPAVSRLSINSHIQAISASPPTYHTSPERGHYQGSSGDDKDNDKDTHKDKYEDKDKDRTLKKKVFLYI